MPRELTPFEQATLAALGQVCQQIIDVRQRASALRDQLRAAAVYDGPPPVSEGQAALDAFFDKVDAVFSEPLEYAAPDGTEKTLPKGVFAPARMVP